MFSDVDDDKRADLVGFPALFSDVFSHTNLTEHNVDVGNATNSILSVGKMYSSYCVKQLG